MDQIPELDWANLPFGYIKTDYNVRCYFRDGKWGDIEVTDSETINLHIASTSLHYGQEIFEGLKAFRGKDGKVRVFRLEENARRIASSARGLLMEPIPEELFTEMVKKAVKLNERFIPPTDPEPRSISAPLSWVSRPEWACSRRTNICS